MEAAENKGFVYEFGRFMLDPQERTLFADGIPLHLPAKEFETLLLLVEHNGQALTKEQMISAVWEDAFVEEGNLAKQVSRLRKILEEDGEKYIETIPKHGYRFSAELIRSNVERGNTIILQKRTVRRLSFESETEPATDRLALRSSGSRSFGKRTWILLGVVLIAAASGLWYWKGQGASTVTKKNAIAILPIRSLTADESERIFAAGIGDALITKLASLREIAVRPGSSVSQFTKESRDPALIGKDLDVQSVLDGTLLQTEGKLRLNLRLIDSQTGVQIWSEKFDSVAGSVFDLEDTVSEKVARAIMPTLTDQRVTKRFTENAAAYDDFIKGRYFLAKRTTDGFNHAIKYFDDAAKKDPQYSLAYTGLADCYILLGVWGASPPNDVFPKAQAAARRALSIDPELAEALVSLAFVEWVNGWDFKQAEKDFQHAIELNPNYATAHHWYSYYLVSQKRHEEAILEITRARELEGPLTLSVNTDIGEIYSWAGRYDEAEKYLRDVLTIEPNYAIAHQVLGINLIKQHRLGEAIAELETARRLEAEPRVLAALGNAYAAAGHKERAIALMDELETISSQRYVSQFSRAVILAGLGEKQDALNCLDNALTERSDTMAIINVYPLLDDLHDEPRFLALTRSIGYEN